MLCLGRRKGEITRLVDRNTGRELGTVTVLDAPPNGRVRLGFEFDSSVRILREEVAAREPVAA